jgi:hypothetical protein
MDSDKSSARVGRLEVEDTVEPPLARGREAQDRPGEPTGAAPSRDDSAAVRRFALITAAMATVVPPEPKDAPVQQMGFVPATVIPEAKMPGLVSAGGEICASPRPLQSHANDRSRKDRGTRRHHCPRSPTTTR